MEETGNILKNATKDYFMIYSKENLKELGKYALIGASIGAGLGTLVGGVESLVEGKDAISSMKTLGIGGLVIGLDGGLLGSSIWFTKSVVYELYTNIKKFKNMSK